MQLADAQPVPEGPSSTSDAPTTAPTDLLTFVIADVRGYTRFTVERGDEAAAELAMKFAALAREAVARHGGEVVELRGDEVLAVFVSTEAALRGAIDLQARLMRETVAAPELPLHAGVGVAVGNAIPVEGGFRGIPLNLAARLCSLAGPGEVLASAGVSRLAGNVSGLTYVERGPVELKGFVDPIAVTQVIGGDDTGEGLVEDRAAVLPLRLPIGVSLGSLPSGSIAGREEELTAIQSAIDAVTEGTGRMIVLSGQRGIGKTRLAQEATLLAHQQGFLIAAGRTYEDQQSTDLSPFTQALGMAFTAAPASIRFAVRRSWPELMPLLPGLGGAGDGAGVLPASESGDAGMDHVGRAAAGFLGALAQERPVALLVDDLQWADDASLRLLTYLARHTRDKRVFILATCRDTDSGTALALDRMLRDLGRERLVERIALRRLPPEGTAAMVAATIGDIEATQEFEEFVHRRTRGIPLYIEQIVRSLGGHYRLIRQIGAGGMGRIFQAVDTQNGDQVAAKIMFASREAGPDADRRFEQEGAVLAELQHPNIVKVHGTFMEEHASCIIMELLEGRSLGESLQSTRFDLARTKRIAEQVSAALAYAHRRGIIHRDIKPDNIMLGPDDQVKVTDFGIARVVRPEATLHTMTSTGVALGTPLYMAPEQIEGKDVDGRADVYALGAVLYQMVTGRPPFEGNDALTIAFKHVGEAPQSPAQLSPGLPAEWENLILKALAKEPAERFASAGAMRRAIAELSVPDTDEQPAPAARNRWRRRALFASPLAALLVGVAAYAVLIPGAHSIAHAAIGAPVPHWGVQASVGKISYPYSLAFDSQGNAYVSDQDNNRVVKLSSAGVPFATWGSSGSGLGQFTLPGQIAAGSKGDTYVIDPQGNRVEEFAPDGTPIASFGSSGSGPGQLSSPVAVAVDGQGHIYVADNSISNSRIEEYFASGKTSPRTFKRFPAVPNEPPGPGGVAVDRAGNVYATVSQIGEIDKYSPKRKLLARISRRGVDNGKLSAASLLAASSAGDIYVLDSNNTRLQEFSPSGAFLQYWTLNSGSAPGRFNTPTGLAADGNGNVYIADAGNDRIQRLTPDGKSFAPWGKEAAPPPRLNQPNGVAADGRGDVYVADTANNRVWQLSGSGRLVNLWGAANGATGTAAGQFNNPYGVAADARGDVYVADEGNNRIELFSVAKQLWSRLGGASLQLNAPYDVAVDGQGDVYVADTGNNAVDEISSAGKLLHRWGAGGGAPGIALGQFHNPEAVALDGQGNLYVADTDNNRVQELSANDQHWTKVSTGPQRLDAPTSIAVDTVGNIDVVDSNHNRVLELAPSGELLGTIGGVKGTRLGQFNAPAAITFDSRGNAYVADTGNNRIEKFAPKP